LRRRGGLSLSSPRGDADWKRDAPPREFHGQDVKLGGWLQL
jgi:hypothetical protein